MFNGSSLHNVDAKGRIILPLEFREELGEEFYVARGYGKCVQVLSKDEYDKKIKQFTKELTAAKALKVIRHLQGSAKLVSPNSQGRITLPQILRDTFCITEEAVVVGMGDFIEIWDKKTYDNEMLESEDDVLDALEQISFGAE